MRLAAVILTHNEEINIAAAITSARQITEEILVIDSGSTDKTLEIAEKEGARIFFRVWDDDFAAQRNFAADKTDADFLFHLDADERITEKLAASIIGACAANRQNIFSIRRVNSAFGKTFKHGFMRPDRVRRLYPRLKSRWEGKVHERLALTLPDEWLAGELTHYTYRTWEQYFVKFNQYTTIAARSYKDQGKTASLTGAFAHASFAFINVFFLKKGFLDGSWGLIMSIIYFMYTLVKYLKLILLIEAEKPKAAKGESV
jgi:glycosyltransferase involved in cell wall biosynthesis